MSGPTSKAGEGRLELYLKTWECGPPPSYQNPATPLLLKLNFKRFEHWLNSHCLELGGSGQVGGWTPGNSHPGPRLCWSIYCTIYIRVLVHRPVTAAYESCLHTAWNLHRIPHNFGHCESDIIQLTLNFASRCGNRFWGIIPAFPYFNSNNNHHRFTAIIQVNLR